ncbi:vacuolar protein sorting-associated protein 13 [Ceratobasidium sp. AG-Ba]|nr:vacuolar protein sorting-associated protein 13 [Ceratobasidium sp. AG-Ba]
MSIEEKYSILKEHNYRRRNHKYRVTYKLKLGPMGDGFSLETEALTAPWKQLFKDGVLAQWSSVLPDSYMPLQLDLVLLPSCNTGQEFKQWRLAEPTIRVREFDIEPAYDLLVLLEYDLGDAVGPANRCRLHFRTLSTNDEHPDAAIGHIDYDISTIFDLGLRVQCFGDAVVSYIPNGSNNGLIFGQEDTTGLLLYNWTTGALLDLSTMQLPRFITVVSKELLIAPRSTFTYGLRNSPIGQLDIYEVDWSDNPSINFVAALQLPIIDTIPVPPPGLHGLSSSHTALVLFLRTGNSSSLSNSGVHARGPAQIFEQNRSSQILVLHIGLPHLARPPGVSYQKISSYIYIPAAIIYDILGSYQNSPAANQSNIISWEQWGLRTRWIHGHLAEVLNFQALPSGSKCIQVKGISQTSNMRVHILDFNPHLLEQLKHWHSQQASDAAEPARSYSGWVYQPAEPNYETPTDSCVPPHTWLKGSGADQAVAPYAWSLVENEDLHRVMKQADRSMRLVWDAEHIVMLQGNTNEETVVLSI